ncbi:MAG: hypothetical protein J0I21_19880 [Alphaproteobacteria bacterium]|nr:hypothetical protein [Alphaproteobacteria bacterium]
MCRSRAGSTVRHATRNASVVLGAALWLLGDGTAEADFKIFAPDVSQGEISVETVGNAGFDPDPELNGARSYTAEFGYGVTRWWKAEVEFQFDREAAATGGTSLARITSENTFQFTAPGQYWLDAGFFAEYAQSVLAGDPNEATLGPLLRKQFWGLTNTVNLFLQKDFGAHAPGPAQFVWAWETRVDALQAWFGDRFTVEPGFQYYGEPAETGSGRDNRIGPQLFGTVAHLGPGSLEWNAGFLIGLGAPAAKFTPRWEFEYDLEF